MSYDNEKQLLINKYSSRAIHTRITDNYVMTTYPSDYYIELIDLLLKHMKK